MCLFTNTNKCSVAERDIIVYKYVAKRVRILDPKFENKLVKQDEDGWQRCAHDFVWVSPYRLVNKTIYNIGSTITDDNFQKTTARMNSTSEFFIVERGLHAYAKASDAMTRADIFKFADGGSGVLKCVIPKGTRYWVSEDTQEYCAETLKIDSLSYEVKI